jgi:ATP-binding protein involved in chromosome partitioning
MTCNLQRTNIINNFKSNNIVFVRKGNMLMWNFGAKLSKELIYKALSSVQDPHRDGDLVSNKLISSITIDDKNIICILEIDPKKAASYEAMRYKTESVLCQLKGVSSAQVILTAQKTPEKSSDKASNKTPAQTAAPQKQAANTKPDSTPPQPPPHTHHQKQAQAKAPSVNPPLKRPDVRHIIAVSSGKGGVGKSTIAFNLSVALKNLGHKVGLVDIDIYGPSQPRLSGLTGINYSASKPYTNEDGKIIPPEAHGIKIMSMGFLIKEESPLIWRGPMVQSAVMQLFRDVDWDGLDYLIIDMPPGTGDAQLTLAQKMPPDGAIIVSTPQDLSLIDARKGLEMYKKTGISIIGIVENMSIFTCPKCGEDTPIFGHDGAKLQAEEINVPFLGAIPLALDIRKSSDAGQPSTDKSYRDIALKVIEKSEQRIKEKTEPSNE